MPQTLNPHSLRPAAAPGPSRLRGWCRGLALAGPLLCCALALAAAQPAPAAPAPAAVLNAFGWPDPTVDAEQRGTYAAANAALAPGTEARTVFLGDSITELWGGLEGRVLEHGGQVLNRGISGQVSTQLLLRFQRDVVALRPRVLVLLVGTNDLRAAGPEAGSTPLIVRERLLDNIASMLDIAAAHGIARVLCAIPPSNDDGFDPRRFPVPNSRMSSAASVRSMNLELARLAREKGAQWVDYHAALADAEGRLRREFSKDGLHPNAAGYAVMWALVAPVIEALDLPARPD